MERTTEQFLYLLQASMHDANVDQEKLSDADWNGIFELARSHQIIPMIYAPLIKAQATGLMPEELRSSWKDMYLGFSLNQLHRTMEFIQVYRQLLQAGIMALVVKGLIFRQLYPDAYYRCSCDEDVLIKAEDYKAADQILIACGLIRIKNRMMESNYELAYKSPKSGLFIELHTSPFQPGVKFFHKWNRLLGDLFLNPLPLVMEGSIVYTLSKEEHLLFMLLHHIKHFLSSGLGIRQLCDMVMYCNRYGRELSWKQIWRVMEELGYHIWLLNMLDIGIKYLGLQENSVQYPQDFIRKDQHSEALLEDMISGGVFGRSIVSREKSGMFMMQSAMIGRRNTLLKSIFPCLDYMKSHYSYCDKYEILLPIAWIHRLLAYAACERSPVRMFHKVRSMIRTGKKRIKLLEEYKMLSQ